VEIATNSITLFSDIANAIPSLWTKNADKEFMMKDITATIPTLVALFSTCNNQFCLFVLLTCVPILCGGRMAYKGTINKRFINAFKLNIKGFDFWTKSMMTWCPKAQHVVFDSYQLDEGVH